MDAIVAVDIETTGLDSERDAIIEVGAVKFNGNRVEAEWSSLVNPARPVPPFISTLTGIDDAMLRNAPSFAEIARDVQTFIGDSPVLGHNVRFDLGFLQKRVSLRGNKVLDTYELASVLIPNASRYNLGSLGKALSVLWPATHRALDDAKVTHGVYLRLAELAADLPSELLLEFMRASEHVEWDARLVFQEILRARGVHRPRAPQRISKPTGHVEGPARPALDTPEALRPLDDDEVASLLEHGGQFSKHFEAYEHRPEQVHMLRAQSQTRFREAGT